MLFRPRHGERVFVDTQHPELFTIVLQRRVLRLEDTLNYGSVITWHMAEKVRTAALSWGMDRWAAAITITLSTLTVTLVALALFAVEAECVTTTAAN